MASLARRRGADGVLLEPGPLLALPGAGEWPGAASRLSRRPLARCLGSKCNAEVSCHRQVTIPPDYSSQWLPKVLLIGFWTHTVSGVRLGLMF